MILSFGILLIIITILVKLNESKISNMKLNPKLKKLVDIGNIDKVHKLLFKIFRFIQYFCFFVAGEKATLTGSSCTYIQILTVSPKQQLL